MITLFITFMILLIASIALVCISIRLRKHKRSIIRNLFLAGSCSLLVVTILVLGQPLLAGCIAAQKGLEWDKLNALEYKDFEDLYQLNKIMPDDNAKQINVDNLTDNDVIIIYRYNCPECKEYVGTIKEYYSNKNKHILWCSSRSIDGKKVLEELDKKVDITSVPTAVYKDFNNNYIKKEINCDIIENNKYCEEER